MFWRFSWDHLFDFYLLQIPALPLQSAGFAAQLPVHPLLCWVLVAVKNKIFLLMLGMIIVIEEKPIILWQADSVSAELVEHSGKRGWVFSTPGPSVEGRMERGDGMALLKITVTVLTLALWFFCVWLAFCLKVFNYQVSFYLEWHVLIHHMTVYTL